MNDIESTEVFQWTWDAIHVKCHVCNGIKSEKPCEFCLDSGREFKYIILEGGSGSSKTSSLCLVFYLYSFHNKNKRLSVWRDVKKDCRDTVMYDMVNRYYPNYPHYNLVSVKESVGRIDFPTGSTIEICGTDDANKVHGWNGHVTWVNEGYKISKDTFDQLDMRAEDFIAIDWNPKMAHFIEDLKKSPRAICIKSTFKNNYFCPPERKLKILGYQPVRYSAIVEEKLLTEAEAKVYNLTENPLKLSEKHLKELARCKENERTGSASAFNWQVYGLGEKAEKPNRIFHWTEISDDDYNKIDAKEYYGVDWGVVDPWGILKCKYYDGALYFHELNYKSENEWRADLLPVEREQVDKQDEGLVRWLFTKLHIPKKAIIVCDNNRQEKIVALRMAGWDYAIEAIKGPGSIIAGISLLQEMRCFYTSSSKNIAYEQENYEWEVDRYGKQLEDPIDTDNHIAGDPPRYIATFLKLQGIIKKI